MKPRADCATRARFSGKPFCMAASLPPCLPVRVTRCSTPYYCCVTEGDRHVRVEVDRDACEANAVCAGLVPEGFEVDDEDELHIQVAEVPPGLAESVRHAVLSCPKAALRLEE